MSVIDTFWKIFVQISVGHMDYWLFFIVKYKIEHNYDKMSSYFYFNLFTDHLQLNGHNGTVSILYSLNVIFKKYASVYASSDNCYSRMKKEHTKSNIILNIITKYDQYYFCELPITITYYYQCFVFFYQYDIDN
jgi:hypothetical protein